MVWQRRTKLRSGTRYGTRLSTTATGRTICPQEEALAKAKELLAEAGYADGLEFDLNIDLGTPEQASMAKIIQSALAGS